jgi:ABC-type sugar transport system permease subunit
MTFIGSLFLALVVSELTKGVVLFNIIFYLPMIIALSMAGLTFSWILHQDVGIFNEFLRRLGFESLARQHWFGDPSTALLGLVVIASWKMIGFTFIIFLAGIQSVPNELREAAKIDGANYWEEVYFIILPLLKPYL